MNCTIKEYKCILVGNRGVGKTKYLNYIMNKEYRTYVPTIGVNLGAINFMHDNMIVQFNVWDISETQNCNVSSCYVNADCAIIMHDKLDHNALTKWYYEIKKSCGDIPIIACINNQCIKFESKKGKKEKHRKYESHEKRFLHKIIKLHKNQHSMYEPFVEFARMLH